MCLVDVVCVGALVTCAWWVWFVWEHWSHVPGGCGLCGSTGHISLVPCKFIHATISCQWYSWGLEAKWIWSTREFYLCTLQLLEVKNHT